MSVVNAIIVNVYTLQTCNEYFRMILSLVELSHVGLNCCLN